MDRVLHFFRKSFSQVVHDPPPVYLATRLGRHPPFIHFTSPSRLQLTNSCRLRQVHAGAEGAGVRHDAAPALQVPDGHARHPRAPVYARREGPRCVALPRPRLDGRQAQWRRLCCRHPGPHRQSVLCRRSLIAVVMSCVDSQHELHMGRWPSSKSILDSHEPASNCFFLIVLSS